MNQLDLVSDFLDPAWTNSDLDMETIQAKVSDEIIAYAPLYHHTNENELDSYFLIVKEQGRNPYHFATASVDFGRFNKEPVPRDFQMSSQKLWTLEWIVEYQRGQWVWKNGEKKSEFDTWLDKKFKAKDEQHGVD